MIARVVAGMLVLALLLVGGDYLARWYVSDKVAAAAQRSLALTEKPSVSISGWPFAPMMVQRAFPEVRVRAALMSVPMLGARYDVKDVQVQFESVTLTDKATQVGKIRGRATMPFDSLGALTKGRVAYASDGHLELKYQFPVAKVPAEVSIIAKPVLDVEKQRIAFENPVVSVNGKPADSGVVGQLISTLAHPVRISVGTVKVTGLTVSEAGMVADIGVEDYRLPPLQ